MIRSGGSPHAFETLRWMGLQWQRVAPYRMNYGFGPVIFRYMRLRVGEKPRGTVTGS